MLKSGTLLSATPECHSQNRERRRSATPFYQKERYGSGTHIFEESENMSGPLLSLFFFWIFFFWHSFSVDKGVSSVVYILLEAKVLLTWHKISCKFPIQVLMHTREKKNLRKITKKRAIKECTLFRKERWGSATLFFQKERYGSATPFFDKEREPSGTLKKRERLTHCM